MTLVFSSIVLSKGPATIVSSKYVLGSRISSCNWCQCQKLVYKKSVCSKRKYTFIYNLFLYGSYK
jgi:hypothetical protein